MNLNIPSFIYTILNWRIPFHPQKIVPAYVKTPLLHCHFGEMSSSSFDPNTRYLYILRKNAREIRKLSKQFEMLVKI